MLLVLQIKIPNRNVWELPGDPRVRPWRFRCRDPGSILASVEPKAKERNFCLIKSSIGISYSVP